ncbi:MAG: hypothetical protein D6798_04695 [Deltaproteobacteria bacterium]|nr:MAG: hypothetical protein D6798_04695 [Deltaproteobacteria bacterium]
MPPPPGRHPRPLHSWVAWGSIGLLACVMVAARALTPSHVVRRTDLIPLRPGTQGGHELVDRVTRYAPEPGDSVIEAVDWTPSGLLVSVRTWGPRVVAVLDSAGRSSVTYARGATTVHLPLPADGAAPPFTITVLQPRGRGGLLDARAVRVASTQDRGYRSR